MLLHIHSTNTGFFMWAQIMVDEICSSGDEIIAKSVVVSLTEEEGKIQVCERVEKICSCTN